MLMPRVSFHIPSALGLRKFSFSLARVHGIFKTCDIFVQKAGKAHRTELETKTHKSYKIAMNENEKYFFFSLMAFDENRTQSTLSLAYDVILSSIISCVSAPTFMCHQAIKKAARSRTK